MDKLTVRSHANHSLSLKFSSLLSVQAIQTYGDNFIYAFWCICQGWTCPIPLCFNFTLNWALLLQTTRLSLSWSAKRGLLGRTEFWCQLTIVISYSTKRGMWLWQPKKEPKAKLQTYSVVYFIASFQLDKAALYWGWKQIGKRKG